MGLLQSFGLAPREASFRGLIPPGLKDQGIDLYSTFIIAAGTDSGVDESRNTFKLPGGDVVCYDNLHGDALFHIFVQVFAMEEA